MSVTAKPLGSGGELAHKHGVSLEDQVEAVHRLNADRGWGFVESDFPAIPTGFTPRKPTEQLLLAAYLPAEGEVSGLERTFLSLWGSVVSPDGFEKQHGCGFQASSDYMRVVGGAWESGLRWVAFDPDAFFGVPVNEALEEAIARGLDLAGTEVLMASRLFTGWTNQFTFGSSPRPILGGLRLLRSGRWASVPFFARYPQQYKFGLGVYGATSRHAGCSVPTVRQL